MKTVTSLLAAFLLAGSVGASNSFAAAEGVISNATLTPGSYCHLRFPAIDEETLSSDRPVLDDASSGEIIDFYGPCNEDPRGMDQIQDQKQEAQHRWAQEYEDSSPGFRLYGADEVRLKWKPMSSEQSATLDN
jgi:hypothetical protein